VIVAAIVGGTLALAACGSATPSSGTGSGGRAKALVGAGSTLVAPLMSVWQPTYYKRYGVAITYGAIGSGGGIVQLIARTVDFGASDAPFLRAQAAACHGCLEIPWALAATLVAYHLKGAPNHLRFSGRVLADIWLGRIRRWDDPAIRRLNPHVKLPDTAILPVHRVDGSGDTYAFVDYLDRVSPRFRAEIGPPAPIVNWPGGVGGRGNSGVGGVLSAANGTIAYIAIAYVLQSHFDYGLVENQAGRFPTPGIPSIAAAADALRSVPAGGRRGVSIVDPPASAPDAYPISTFTYVLVPTATRPGIAPTLRRFISWAVTAGQRFGPKLDFAPLPQAVVRADLADVRLIR